MSSSKTHRALHTRRAIAPSSLFMVRLAALAGIVAAVAGTSTAAAQHQGILYDQSDKGAEIAGADGDCPPQDSNTLTENPVSLMNGVKTVTEIDLIVSMPGRDFEVIRNYSSARLLYGSNPDLFNSGYVGINWTLNLHRKLSWSLTGSPPDWVRVSGYPLHEILQLEYVTSSSPPEYVMTGPGQSWVSHGPSVTFEGRDYETWRYTEPGGEIIDFIRDAEDSPSGSAPNGGAWPDQGILETLILRTIDPHGNTAWYSYEETASDDDYPRINNIQLRDATKSLTDDPNAKIEFTYQDTGFESHFGRYIDSIVVKRHDGSSWVETQKVEYNHVDESATYDDNATPAVLAADVGRPSSLIEVVHSTLVDGTDGGSDDAPAGGATWYSRITQYRYLEQSAYTWASDPRLDNQEGYDLELYAVFSPHQIEFLANALGEENSTVETVQDAAAELRKLDMDDALTVFGLGSNIVADAASKIVFYDSNGSEVAYQYVQSDCGCGGSIALGSQLQYEYFTWREGPGSSGNYGRTVKITESIDTAAAGDYDLVYRTEYYDFKRISPTDDLDATGFLINHAIQEGSGSTYWVDHFEYNEDDTDDQYRTKTHNYTRSATNSYTPYAGFTTPPAYSSVSTGGLVHKYTYNDDDRVVSEQIRNAAGTGYDTVTEYAYNTTHDRTDLVTSVTKHRVAGASVANDKEVTTFTYGFFDADADLKYRAVSWIKTEQERELVSENGPNTATTVSRWDLFDITGENIWTVHEDESLTKRDYDAATGELATLTRNADAPANWNDFVNPPAGGGNPSSGWGPDSAGESVTAYDLDLLGRRIKSTDPAGVESYRLRALWDNSLRAGVRYYAEIDLPYEHTTDKYDGPVVMRWRNAAGDVIRTSEYTIDTSVTYQPDPTSVSAVAYTFETTTSALGVGEIARSASVHNIYNQVTKSLRWHDVSAGDSGKYTVDHGYDNLGRRTRVIDDNDTITEYDYDVLDRVIEQRTGVDQAGTQNSPVTVAQYYYDGSVSFASSAPSGGVGNGTVTAVREFTGEGDETRTTYAEYDWRDRLVSVYEPINDDDGSSGGLNNPDLAIGYDNLDRVTSRALFEDTSGNPAVPLDPSTTTGRVWYETCSFSQRGLEYLCEYAVTPSSGSTAFLELNRWYDDRGRKVAEWGPNAPAEYWEYDALNRVTRMAYTDRAGDAKPGDTDNYDDAASLTGDRVLEQVDFTYDLSAGATGNLLTLERTVERFHDYTSGGTGALSTTTGVATYIAYYYDGAARLVEEANYGTARQSDDLFQSESSLPGTWPPTSAPTRSGNTDVLITSYAYNTRGLVEDKVLPEVDSTAERPVRTIYDDLERVIAVIENAQDVDASDISFNGTAERWEVSSGLDSTDQDEDRVTSTVYDGADQVVKLVAHLPPDGATKQFQETEYVYGTTNASSPGVTDSLVASNSLLAEIRYPVESTGVAGTTDEFKVKIAYNRLGEPRAQTDQNGTVRTFQRDIAGRITEDEVNQYGSGVDDYIDRLVYAFDSAGRLTSAKSYDDAGTPTVVNEVGITYTALWQVAEVEQDVDSELDATGGLATQAVTYAYENKTLADASGTNYQPNHSRLDSIIYPAEDEAASPNASTLDYDYDNWTTGAAALNERISRVAALSVSDLDSAGSGNLVEYDYVGLSRFVTTTLPQPASGSVRLDYSITHTGASTAGSYPGLDQYGRVVRQLWVDDGYSVNTSDSNYPDRPAIVEQVYTYDRDSNRLQNTDGRVGPKPAITDFEFTYDALDRLSKSKRHPFTTTDIVDDEIWEYDLLGNWEDYSKVWDVGGTPTKKTDDRTHDFANELDDIASGGATDTAALAYTHDKNGNRTQKRRTAGQNVNDQNYEYDAWNRLVRVTADPAPASPGDMAGEYEYNALSWRTIRRANTSTSTVFPVDEERQYYYSADWRLLEERVDRDDDDDLDWVGQQFWGERYIDDAVANRIDRNADLDFADAGDQAWFYLTDIQFSVAATLDDAGDLFERIVYDPYGEAWHMYAGDSDGDGVADTDDYVQLYSLNGKYIHNAGYVSELDIDRDGDIDSTDLTLHAALLSAGRTALPEGWISDPAVTDGPDNMVGYDGYLLNSETLHYAVRFRAYDPTDTGRWLQKDPLSYVGGSLMLYQYVNSEPTMMRDPLGLAPWYEYVPAFRVTKWVIEVPSRIWPKGTRDSDRRFKIEGDQAWPETPGTVVDDLDDVIDELENRENPGKPLKKCRYSTHGSSRGGGQIDVDDPDMGSISKRDLEQIRRMREDPCYNPGNRQKLEKVERFLKALEDNCDKVLLEGCNVGAPFKDDLEDLYPGTDWWVPNGTNVVLPTGDSWDLQINVGKKSS